MTHHRRWVSSARVVSGQIPAISPRPTPARLRIQPNIQPQNTEIRLTKASSTLTRPENDRKPRQRTGGWLIRRSQRRQGRDALVVNSSFNNGTRHRWRSPDAGVPDENPRPTAALEPHTNANQPAWTTDMTCRAAPGVELQGGTCRRHPPDAIHALRSLPTIRRITAPMSSRNKHPAGAHINVTPIVTLNVRGGRRRRSWSSCNGRGEQPPAVGAHHRGHHT